VGAERRREKVNEKEIDRWSRVEELWQIIVRLRSESGCPWDRKQTPEKVQTYLVEECHEAAAAVRAGKAEDVAEELGDVLFMVLFLVYLYEQRGDFVLEDVCAHISAKMIRRHPHVFGEVSVDSAEEVYANWQKIKEGEKKENGKVQEPVPESLPALMRAYRILSRLSHKDDGWNDIQAGAKAFGDRSRELTDRVAKEEPVSPNEIGRLLLELVNIARIKGFRAEDVLHDLLPVLEVSQ
jgi:MazG family protein